MTLQKTRPLLGNITDVKDTRTRNLLRGLLTHEINDTIFATYKSLRAETSFEDIDLVSRLLLQSPLFAHLPLVDDFPTVPISPGAVLRADDQPLANEIVYQCVRFEKHFDKLSSALESLCKLNTILLNGRRDEAIAALAKFSENFGYSLIHLSKLAYTRTQFATDEGVTKYCGEELEKYGTRRRSAIALGTLDMMGDAYEFLALRRNLLEFARTKGTPFTRDIVTWQFRPIRHSKDDIASKLQSHGLSSVLDAFIFLMIHRYNVSAFKRFDLDSLVDEYIPQFLQDVWTRLSQCHCPSKNILFDRDEPEFNDYVFYRRSLAWIEVKTVSQFRSAIDQLFIENTSNEPASINVDQSYLDRYFSSVTSLNSLAAPPSTYEINLEKYSNDTAGHFLRTIAFTYLLRKGACSSDLSSAELLSLLNWTIDIAKIGTVDELRRFFDNPNSDVLSRYLANAILSDCSGLNIDKHRLRRSLQSLVQERYGNDILEFAKALLPEYRQVALHLFGTCTEEFLVQLFLLLTTPEMVFETRARLLDWYADAFNEPTAKERAKTLRLDQRLRAVRGEIDDTRIYVDPLRFGQWLQDNTLDQLSVIFREEDFNDDAVQAFREFGDFTHQRQPHVRLALVIQAAFEEFCTNKRYGADSYLGRRIRHGTLKGVLVTQVQEILSHKKFEQLLGNRNARNYLENWLEQYLGVIDFWGKEIFQVRGKQKPRGALVPDVTTSSKIETTRTAIRDIKQTFIETSNLATASQTLIEWCWRLIEKDLNAIRMMIDSARTRVGAISRLELQREVSDDLKQAAADICREINAATDEKFHLISRWFTKPKNLAPSTSLTLLLDAVLAEVKEHFPDYAPKIERHGLSDIELVGMYYHHVYDFLYVVIYNAAKHGNRRGLLGQTIDLSDGASAIRKLIISIASQISSHDTISTARFEIDSAMSGSIEDAMVNEGRSGVKKLLRLNADVREIENIDVSYGTDTVSFRCVMNLPVA